jgi:hypothetical protein
MVRRQKAENLSLYGGNADAKEKCGGEEEIRKETIACLLYKGT